MRKTNKDYILEFETLELRRKFKAKCGTEGTSMKAELNRMVKEYVEEEKK